MLLFGTYPCNSVLVDGLRSGQMSYILACILVLMAQFINWLVYRRINNLFHPFEVRSFAASSVPFG
jgi:hypothetical protein